MPDSDDDKDDDDGDDTADNSGNGCGGSDGKIDDIGDASGDDDDVFGSGGGGGDGADDVQNGHSDIDFDVDLANSIASGLRGTVPYENSLVQRNDAPSVDVEAKRGTELKQKPAPTQAEAGTTSASRGSSCAVSQIVAEHGEDCVCSSGDSNERHNDATASAECEYEYCNDKDKSNHDGDGDDDSCVCKFTANEREEDAVNEAFATLTLEEETTPNRDSVSVTASRQPDLGLHSAGHNPDGASGEPIDEDSDDGIGESIDKDGVDNIEDDCDSDDENEGDDSGNLRWSKAASGADVVVRNPTFHHMPPKDADAKDCTERNDADDGNNDNEKRCGDRDDDDENDNNDDEGKDDDNNKHVMTVTEKSGDDATLSRNVLHNKQDAKVANDEDEKEQDRGRDSSFSSCVSVSSRDLTAASGDNEDCSFRDFTEAFASIVEKKMSASCRNAMHSSDNASTSQDDEENYDSTEKMDAFQLEEDQFESMSEIEFEDFPDISSRADSKGRYRHRRHIVPASPWSSLMKYVGGKVWQNRSRQTGDDSSSVVTVTTATNTVTTGTLSEQPPFAMNLLEIGKSWNTTFIPSMSTSRSGFAGVMLREEGKIVVMGGREGSERVLSSVECIFPHPIQDSKLKTTPTWTAMPPMARPRSSFCAAIVTTRLATTTATLVPSSIKGDDYPPPHHQCRHIVVAGGVIDDFPTKSAEVFNLSTNQWTNLPPLRVKRCGCAVTSLYSSSIVRGDDGNEEDCGRVYVVGGGLRNNTVEWLDVSAALQGGNSETAGWRYLPSKMKRGRLGCAAVMVEWSEGGVVSGGKSNAVEGDGDASLRGVQLVVVGGWTEEGTTNHQTTDTAECFDFGRGQWHDLPPMTTHRVGCAGVAIGCSIFVVGGSDANGNALATAEYFDFGTNCWTRLAPTMSVPRSACAAMVMTDTAIGNHDVDNHDNGDNICHRLVVLGGWDSKRRERLSSMEVVEIREADAAKQAAMSSPTVFQPPSTSPPIDHF